MSDVASHITKYSTEEEAKKLILEDNQKRCEFFKYFEYDTADIIGSVSSVDLEILFVQLE